MDEKSLWSTIGGLVGKRSDAKALDTRTRHCPNGHPMAIDWTDCPYCRSEKNSSGGTVAEPPVRAGETRATRATTDAAVGGSPSERRPTRVFDNNIASSSSRRETKVFNDQDNRGPPPTPPSGRPLTGILFTFSWAKVGQIFHLYAGRNYAGCTDTTREGEVTNVLLTDDPTLSGTHFLILCQAGKYRISDSNSTNGTFVNGQQIDPQGIELKDDAKIFAGNTTFIFRKVLPPTSAEVTEQIPTGYQATPTPEATSQSQ